MPVNVSLDQSRLSVSHYVSTEQTVTLTLRNLVGQVLQIERRISQSGLNRYELNAAGLAPGLYLLEVTGNGVRETAKVYVE
jgi:hypothetical protein